MSKYINFTADYLPGYVPPPEILLWYEKDSMYWWEYEKCQDMPRETNKHFKTTKVMNFDIIYRQTRGEKVPKNFFEKKEFPNIQNQNKKNCASALKTDRKDIHLKRETILIYFKTLS